MTLPVTDTITYANGATTWLNNNHWQNGGNVSKAAKIAKKIIPSFVYKKLQASLPEPALYIDLGSKSPSARLMSYQGIGKKTEVEWGNPAKGGIAGPDQGKGNNIQAAEAGFITEIVESSLKMFPNRKIEIIATAWARDGYADATKVNAEARKTFVQNFVNNLNQPKVSFKIAEQDEESRTAQASLEHITKTFTKLLGKFKGTVKSADGGTGSTQGYGSHELPFGAMQSRAMLLGAFSPNVNGGGAIATCADGTLVQGVDAAQKYIEEKIAANFTVIGANDKPTEPVLGGSHMYALLKNPGVCTQMGLAANSPKWQTGLNAVAVRDALDREITAQKAKFEQGYPTDAEHLSKKFGKNGEITLKTPAEIAALDEDVRTEYNDRLSDIEAIAAAGNLKGLLITRAVINSFIVKHRTTTIHCAPDGDIKPTHYHGAYVERVVQPFFATKPRTGNFIVRGLKWIASAPRCLSNYAWTSLAVRLGVH